MNESERLAQILSKSRYESGISQEKMAIELGVSKQSIINWEKGTSCPKFSQIIKWYDMLGVNMMRPIMEAMYPDLYQGISSKDSDEKLLHSTISYIELMPIEAQRGITYILLGEHGSDPSALIHLFIAYLHLPFTHRVSIARSIVDNYEICNRRGELICDDHIMPNIEFLHDAIELGKDAAINNKSGYQKN